MEKYQKTIYVFHAHEQILVHAHETSCFSCIYSHRHSCSNVHPSVALKCLRDGCHHPMGAELAWGPSNNKQKAFVLCMY